MVESYFSAFPKKLDFDFLGLNSVKIHVKPPLRDGNSPVTGYQAISTPHDITGTAVQSPITIRGLKTGVWYTFVVRARNRRGLGPPSIRSDPVRLGMNSNHEIMINIGNNF